MEIYVKGGYSDRIGITHFKDATQFRELNLRTRKKLFDVFWIYVCCNGNVSFDYCIEYLYTEIFGLSSMKIHRYSDGSLVMEKIKEELFKIFSNYRYEELFNLLEAIASTSKSDDFYKDINSLFLSENIQHRFINGQITDIISEEEVKSVDEAAVTDIYGVHIDKAIKYLYDRNSLIQKILLKNPLWL